jgi:hypothetical protein
MRGMGSIFNIVGCSAALLCHLAGNPVAHPKNRRAVIRQLLNCLHNVPRSVGLHNLRHAEGHRYVFTVDADLPDDSASSTIVLLEDGKSLPRWHCRDGKSIATEGLGRYAHAGNAIHFSTSDNSSPLTNGRKYTALHTVTTDPATFGRLTTWRKTAKTTGAAQLFEMLRILWPGYFEYGTQSGAGPDAVLTDLRFAIDQEKALRLAAGSLSARPVAGATGQWDFEIAGLAPIQSPREQWSLRGRVDLSPSADILLLSLGVDGPDGFYLSFDHATPGTLAARFGKLGIVRTLLLAEFREMAALETWTGTLARLITAPLSEGGFELALDQKAARTLAQLFSDDIVARDHELTVRTVDGVRQAMLNAGRA